jgi:hypothetical protein
MPIANTTLTGVLAEHVRAVNAFDTDGVVATEARARTIPCDLARHA